MTIQAIIGPPGTGKTRRVSKDVARVVESEDAKAVTVLSLTRAAAQEAAQAVTKRADGKVRVGTIHSLMYNLLKSPKLFGAEHTEQWGLMHPGWKISPEIEPTESDIWGRGRCNPGDKVFSKLNILRSRLVPPAEFPAEARGFYEAWTEFKDEHEIVDFTDLLESHRKIPVPPRELKNTFVDEAQDLSPLELSILAKWHSMGHIERLTMVGDEDQALYHWRGSAQGGVTENAEQTEVLAQSYRVPRRVHKVAQGIISRVGDRIPVAYEPVERDGGVSMLSANYRDTGIILDRIEKEMSIGRSVMVVGLCGYMLGQLQAALKKEGLPYGNPYSDRWNPLSSKRGTATAERMKAFLRPTQEDPADPYPKWTATEIASWSDAIRASVFKKQGIKKLISEWLDTPFDSDEDFSRYLVNQMSEDGIDALEGGAENIATLGKFFLDNSLKKYRDQLEYTLAILERRGWGALEEDAPSICIGTIHSVKGGEADTVIVFPDLSPSAHKQGRLAGYDGVDALRRTFYVAVTRAKQHLIVCKPAGPRHFRIL